MTVINVAKVQGDIYKQIEKFGRYQLFQYFLICIPLFMVSMAHVNYVFVAEEVDYRCKVPECESLDPSVKTPPWWPENVDEKCFRPVIDPEAFNLGNHTCSNSTFVELLEECDEWIYENHNSIFSELNLGCESWKATLVGSVHNAGMILSMLFTGWVTDKLGRKPTLIICSVGGCIGAIKIFITSYYTYLVVEFLESVVCSGLYTVAVVLLIEVGGESKRVLAGVIFSYAVYVGEVAFAFIAMGLKFWKLIVLVVYTPMILLVSYIILLKESTRWQMLRGKMTEAKDTLKVISKSNKLNISPEEIDALSDEEIRMKFNIETQKEKENFRDILNSKEIMTRIGVTSICFFTSSFLYYGLVVHSILLPGNKYTNFILSSLTSFPGDLLAFYTFNKFGRRITLQSGYAFSAIFLIAQTYAPDSITWLKVLLFLLGKLGVVVCFTGIYTYSLELFPTSVRGSLVGCGNTAARIGAMLAPLTPLLTTELTALPSILFSSTAVVSALLLTFTPETRTMPMFDTIAQIDSYKNKVTTHL
ncbi:organic cation transporter protein-like [Galleria mellonella]|uniref:Organic cation transporter protein-like n=1 Tax=Galleria mellonella TaxID=7137 RepID=A0A6J1W7V6_GALME|nr:organic cation transporter protein-like [Galleria mellonella]